MAGASEPGPHRRVDALAVVADEHPELPLAVMDGHVDLRRLCVEERVAQRLGCGPIDVVALEWMEGAWRAFDVDLKGGPPERSIREPELVA